MPSMIGQSLDHYHILDQLGEGGMAIVYRAQDIQLARVVAVKVIRSEIAESKNFKARFDREAQILGKLTHQHIVQVLDFGDYESQAYLVMEYVSGGSLSSKMKAPMKWQEASRWLAPIARALEYAHSQNVIHRDMKPSNILISESGEPMLSDFGIAKILDEQVSVSLTKTGNMVGSPDYMAPEQGLGKPVDHRVDIYALGTIFYQMVTGTKPYHEDTPMATLMKKVEAAPTRPSELKKDLPKAVEQVILKAMERRPEDRFQSMGEFAEIIEQFAKGDLSLSKIVSGKVEQKQMVAHAWRWAVVSLTAILLLAAVWAFFGRSLNPASLAGLFKSSPTPSATATPLPPTATNTLTATSTLTLTPSATPTRTDTPTPMPQYQILNAANLAQLIKLQTFDTGEISITKYKTEMNPFTFSADGKLVGINQGGKIGIFSTDTWQQVQSVEGTFPVAFSPDGTHIVTSGDILRVWNIADGSLVNKLEGMNYVGQILFSPDGKLITTEGSGGIWLWRASDRKLLKTLSDAGEFAFTPDGKILVTGPQSYDLKDCENEGANCGAIIRSTSVNLSNSYGSMELSPDGSMVWYGGYLWSVKDGKVLLNNGGYSRGAVFSTDGKLLAVTMPTQAIQVYDTTTMQPYSPQFFGSIDPYGYFTQGNLFLPDGSAIIIQRQKDFMFADSKDGKAIYTFSQKNGIYYTVSQDGRFVLILSNNANSTTLEIWGVKP